MGKFAAELLPKFADSTEPTLADFKPYTVGWCIQKYIEEMASSEEMKSLGESQVYTLRGVARSLIGQKKAAALTKADIIAYARWRRQQRVRNTQRKVGAATCGQSISFLGVVLDYAGSGVWEGCDEISSVPIRAARKFLQKHNLVGKSIPRKRRPTDAEIGALLDFYGKQVQHPRTKINMPLVIAFALASTRRLGEICRITWGDIDWQKRTYWVRDVKHPKIKIGNHKEFPLFDELAEIIKRQTRLTLEPKERVFPYNSKSCSQSCADAKRRLNIVGLRFHDLRREAISRWLARGLPPHKVKQISGHETTHVLERVYDAPKAEDLHAEIAGLVKKPDAQQQPSPR